MTKPRGRNLERLEDFLAAKEPPLRASSVDATQLVLPVDQLDEEVFEVFAADLLHLLPEISDVQRLGEAGQTQWGLDGYASDGQGRFGWQAKRVERFGPADLDNESQKLDSNPENPHRAWLLTTCTASAQLRRAAEHSRWSIKDIDDISRMVRQLKPEDATNLLLHYFPEETVARFLGGRLPILRRPSDFLSRRMDADSALSLAGPCVGREDALRAAVEADCRIVVLEGGAGQGKTRMLLEFERYLPDHRVVMLGSSILGEHVSMDWLDSSDIVLVDDLHERDDLRDLARLACGSEGRFIAASRTGEDITDFVSGVIDGGGEFETQPVPELSQGCKEELVRHHGPNLDPLHVAQLVDEVGDCLAALVVSARLYEHGGSIDPEAHFDLLRKLAIHPATSFLKTQTDGDAASALLGIIALAGPIPASAITALAGEFDVAEWRIDKMLAAAISRGLVSEARDGYRVVPMIVADALAAQALHRHERTTLARLERLPIDPARVVWSAMRSQWCMPIAERKYLPGRIAAALLQAHDDSPGALAHALRCGRPVAPLVAAHTRKLIDRGLGAMKHEAPTLVEDVVTEGFGLLSVATRLEWPSDVPAETSLRDEIGASLRALLPHDESTRYAIRTLLSLAETDTRSANQHPRHPARILHDIGDLGAGFDELAIATLIDEVRDSIDRRSGCTGIHFPVLAALTGIFAREVTLRYSSERGVRLSNRPVVAERTAAHRQRVVELCADYLKRSDRTLRGSAEAYMLLARELNLPPQHHGSGNGPSEDEQWLEAIGDALDRIEGLLAEETDSALRLVVRDQVQWHAKYGSGELRTRCANLWNKLNDEPGVALATALLPDRFITETLSQSEDFEDAGKLQAESIHEVAVRLSKSPTGADQIVAMSDSLNEISNGPYGEELRVGLYRPRSGRLIAAAVGERASFFDDLVDNTDQDTSLALGAGLSQFRSSKDYPDRIAQLADHSPAHAASSLDYGILGAQDIELFRDCLRSNDPAVVAAVGTAARNVLSQHGDSLVQDLTRLDPAIHFQVIEWFLNAVSTGSIQLIATTESDARKLLELASLTQNRHSLVGYGRRELAKALGLRHPLAVIESVAQNAQDWSADLDDVDDRRGSVRDVLVLAQPLTVQSDVIAVVRTALLASTYSDHHALGRLYGYLVGSQASPIASHELDLALSQPDEFEHLIERLDGRLFLADIEPLTRAIEIIDHHEPTRSIELRTAVERRILVDDRPRVIPTSGSDLYLDEVTSRCAELIDECAAGTSVHRFLVQLAAVAKERNQSLTNWRNDR